MLWSTAVGCRTLPFGKAAATEEKESATSEDIPATPTAVLPVGVVEHVDAAGEFVLIRSRRGTQFEPDSILTIYSDSGQAVARVKVSPARKGPFLTADIVDGTPAVGNPVTADYATRSPSREASAGGAVPSSGQEVQVLE